MTTPMINSRLHCARAGLHMVTTVAGDRLVAIITFEPAPDGGPGYVGAIRREDGQLIMYLDGELLALAGKAFGLLGDVLSFARVPGASAVHASSHTEQRS